MASPFFASELKQVLSEQSFGIMSYRLGPTSSHEAQASIDLLEGIRLDVRLNIRGFEVS